VDRDHLRLNDIVLFAHLGVSEAEREVGQRIHIDLDLEMDLEPPAASDALGDTVNYEVVYREVERLVGESRHKLMEHLAGTLVRRLFEMFPAHRIRIRVRKPNVPFAGSLASAEVELERSR
jgi:dihydroneopterin aldolase